MSTHDRQADYSRRPFSFPGTASRQQQQRKQQQEQEQEQQNQHPHPHQHQIRSRFVEGSMSDRASAAPPVAFLGPESTGSFFSPATSSNSGYQQQQQQSNYARHSMQSTTPYFAQPGVGSIGSSGSDGSSRSSGSDGSGNGNGNRRPVSFLAPLWDGVRWLHRRRRGGAEASVATAASAPALAPTPSAGPVPAAGTACANAAEFFRPAAAGGQPLSDDIVANYQQLMQSGFFRARAIPATRQGLTRGGGGGGSGGGGERKTEEAEEAEGGKVWQEPTDFPQGGDQCQAEMARSEMAEAVSAVVPVRTADEVLAVLTQSFANGSPQAALATSPAIVRRGTKRGHADVEGAEGDRCEADSGSRVITTARSRGKLAKKLRKTASRTEREGEGGDEGGEDRERWRWEGEAEGYGSSWRTRSMGRRDAAVSVHQKAPPARHALLNKRSSKGTGLQEREQERGQERERMRDDGRRSGEAVTQQRQQNQQNQQNQQLTDSRLRGVTRSGSPPAAELRKKKRRSGGSTAAVVVHQDGEERQRDEGEDEDEDNVRRWVQPREQRRQQRPLQPVHIQRPLQPLRPLQSLQQQQQQGTMQKPISFHYPQRIRMPPLQSSGGGEHKPVQAQTRRTEDTENMFPTWED